MLKNNFFLDDSKLHWSDNPLNSINDPEFLGILSIYPGLLIGVDFTASWVYKIEYDVNDISNTITITKLAHL